MASLCAAARLAEMHLRQFAAVPSVRACFVAARSSNSRPFASFTRFAYAAKSEQATAAAPTATKAASKRSAAAAATVTPSSPSSSSATSPPKTTTTTKTITKATAAAAASATKAKRTSPTAKATTSAADADLDALFDADLAKLSQSDTPAASTAAKAPPKTRKPRTTKPKEPLPAEPASDSAPALDLPAGKKPRATTKKRKDESSTATLVDKLKAARTAYYYREPIMADSEYDRLEDELKAIDPAHPFLASVGASVPDSSVLPKLPHAVPMLSLPKIKSVDALEDAWSLLKPNAVGICVSQKLDGMAVSLQYEDGKLVQALTRGDGQQGESILHNVLQMQGLPASKSLKSFSGIVRGEIVCARKNFKFFPKYTNLRNIASGMCRLGADKPQQGQQHINIVAFKLLAHSQLPSTSVAAEEKVKQQAESQPATPPAASTGGARQKKKNLPSPPPPSEPVAEEVHTKATELQALAKLGFDVPAFKVIYQKAELLDVFVDAMRQRESDPQQTKPTTKPTTTKTTTKTAAKTTAKTAGAAASTAASASLGPQKYQIDGLVLDFDPRLDLKVLALKFPSNTASTVLRDIIWQANSTKIVPLAQFDTVQLTGSSISRASIGSFDKLKALWQAAGSEFPHQGDTIMVSRRNDIIPCVDGVLRINHKGKVCAPPTTCPACAAPLAQVGANLVCENSSCTQKELQAISAWTDALAIPYWSSEIIKCLAEGSFIKTFADLYSLTVEQLAALKTGKAQRRLGPSKATTMVAALKDDTVPLSRIITGFGIPSLGPTSAQKIAKEIQSWEQLQAIDSKRLLAAGISASKAQTFAQLMRPKVKTLAPLVNNRLITVVYGQ